MVELLIRPTLHRFETCLDFVKEFHPGERDLVLTNKYIYEPYLGQMGLPVHTIYQEEAWPKSRSKALSSNSTATR